MTGADEHAETSTMYEIHGDVTPYLSVPCPRCGAPVDAQCAAGNRLVSLPHPERVAAAEAARGELDG